MKTYVITTGVIFGLITVAHVCRIVVENGNLAADPWFIGITVLTTALSFWAWRLVRLSARR